MNNVVNKEQKLYDNIQANSHSTPTFLTAFADYLGFLTTGGFELITHLTPEILARKELVTSIDLDRENILKDTRVALKQLKEIADKHELHDKNRIQEGIRCLTTLIEGSYTSSSNDPLGSRNLDLLDAVKELYELGFEEEATGFLNEKLISVQDIGTKHLIAFKKEKNYVNRFREFHEQDKLTLAGAVLRIINLYHQMLSLPDDVRPKANDFIDALQDPIKRVSYQNKIKQATLSTKNTYPKEGISQDISRLHDSMHFNLTDTPQAKLFEIKHSHLYFKTGKLVYDTKPNGADYGYLELFKNVIKYMPVGVIELQIYEFTKLIPDGAENNPEKYRTQLSGDKSGLTSLFSKNNIINSHPNDQRPIFTITRNSIRFNNLYLLE
jgi:hypothetical protein